MGSAGFEAMLQPDEVHIWSIVVDRLPDSAHVPAQLEVLSDAERDRMDRFRRPIDRRMYGISHVLLRMVLARYESVPPELLRFSRGAHGKPALVDSPGSMGVEFNLSHARGLAVVAVARGRAVGIDAERGDRSIGALLASRIFSPSERTGLDGMSPDDRARAMVRLWTLKEAYVKALGVGLSLSVADLSFGIAEEKTPRFEPVSTLEHDPARWSFFELGDLCPFVASIAVENPGGDSLVLQSFNGELLLREN
jgi:4'-phosphopantetheinyl transferase